MSATEQSLSQSLAIAWPHPPRDRGAKHWRDSVLPTLEEIRETILRPRPFRFEDTKIVRRLTVAMLVTVPEGITALAPEDSGDSYWSPSFWNSVADPEDQRWVAHWVGTAFASGTYRSTSLDLDPMLVATMVDALVEQWAAQAWHGVTSPRWCSELVWEIRRDAARGYRDWNSIRGDMTAFLKAANAGAPPLSQENLNTYTGQGGLNHLPMGVLSGQVSGMDLASYCLALKILGCVQPQRMPTTVVNDVATLESRLDTSDVSPLLKSRAQVEWDRFILERSTLRARKKKAAEEKRNGLKSPRIL